MVSGNDMFGVVALSCSTRLHPFAACCGEDGWRDSRAKLRRSANYFRDEPSAAGARCQAARSYHRGRAAFHQSRTPLLIKYDPPRLPRNLFAACFPC
jgi:hypothetical protein